MDSLAIVEGESLPPVRFEEALEWLKTLQDPRSLQKAAALAEASRRIARAREEAQRWSFLKVEAERCAGKLMGPPGKAGRRHPGNESGNVAGFTSRDVRRLRVLAGIPDQIWAAELKSLADSDRMATSSGMRRLAPASPRKQNRPKTFELTLKIGTQTSKTVLTREDAEALNQLRSDGKEPHSATLLRVLSKAVQSPGRPEEGAAQRSDPAKDSVEPPADLPPLDDLITPDLKILDGLKKASEILNYVERRSREVSRSVIADLCYRLRRDISTQLARERSRAKRAAERSSDPQPAPAEPKW